MLGEPRDESLVEALDLTAARCCWLLLCVMLLGDGFNTIVATLSSLSSSILPTGCEGDKSVKTSFRKFQGEDSLSFLFADGSRLLFTYSAFFGSGIASLCSFE